MVDKKIVKIQFVILLLGTIFAWGNLALETYNYLNQKPCQFSCTAGNVVNPVFTPCFYGALFFLTSFILSAVMFKQSRSSVDATRS
ncbi:hypothetical protein HGA64_02610 [Candidatus Falkowbacteria bacterium]|nr:hypothetical protein [Candidatus Falkowbacteria bacterium]